MSERTIDPGKCPLCGQGNACGNLAGKPHGSCWCSDADFPRGIFAAIPGEMRNRVCICEACLARYKGLEANTP